MATSTHTQESDLYPPVKKFLESQGYEVKGEVKNCDVTGVRNSDTICVVELKLSLNLKLILQAVERLEIADYVYLAIPESDSFYKKNKKTVKTLLKLLGMGLILVSSKFRQVEIIFDPSEYHPRILKKKRGILLKEFIELEGDPNSGGSPSRSKKFTAYRQKAIKIAVYLNENGTSKASVARDGLKIEKTRSILYQNHYNWFTAYGKGMYGLSELGKKELSTWLDAAKK